MSTFQDRGDAWYWVRDYYAAITGKLGGALQDRANQLMESGEYYAKRSEYGPEESWKVWRDVRQAEGTRSTEPESKP